MAGLTFRLGIPDDDPTIRNLLCEDLTARPLSIAFRYEPSFFGALAAQGGDPKVVVAESQGTIVGVGTASRRDVFINGSPETVGYLSNLRVASGVRGTAVLARGYRFFRKVHEETLRLPFYLTTIMQGNEEAIQILTSGRAGLPNYRELGGYRTVLIPVLRGCKPSRALGCRILTGLEAGTAAVLEAFAEAGSRRQYFPVIGQRDLAGGTGAFPEMRLDDLLVARRGAEIVGTFGLWDQTSFRQICISHYGPALRVVRGLAAAVAPLLGGSPLPPCGKPASIALGAWITCKRDDPSVFHSLISHALAHLKARGTRWLAVGLTTEDPLLETAAAFFHLSLNSRIFRVSWTDRPAAGIEPDNRPLYLELGTL